MPKKAFSPEWVAIFHSNSAVIADPVEFSFDIIVFQDHLEGTHGAFGCFACINAAGNLLQRTIRKPLRIFPQFLQL